MNENKLSLILNRVFHILFLLCFGSLFLAVILFGYHNDNLGYSQGERVAVILGFLILLCVFTAVYIYIQNYNIRRIFKKLKQNELLSDKTVRKIIFASMAVMLVIQLIIGYFLEMTPVTDLKNLNKYGLDFAQNGNFDLIQTDYKNDYAYLIRYPNNLALVFFLSFLYRFAYLIFGYVPMYLPVVINALAINISVLLGVFIARKMSGNKTALTVLLLSFLFAPFYTYVSYYYTDSISMPFCMSAVYLFICGVKSEGKYKKYLLPALAGALIFLGYKIKGSVIILLAAAIIFIILKCRTKKAVCMFLVLAAGFGIVSTVYTAEFNSSQIITEEQSDEYQYPYTHWVMMGLNGLGGYNKDDDMYTRSFSDINAKQEANIKEIAKRISDYGLGGLTKHIAKKAVWTWEDGTYYISHHIEKAVRQNVLHSFVLDKGENHLGFYVYSCSFQLFLLFMICMSAIKGCIKPQVNIQTFLKVIVFGAFIFFIIWETRSRYLYNFTPIFILLAVDGLDFFAEGIKQKYFRKAK